MKFTIRLPAGEDGPHEYVVNGVEVGSACHDSVGWEGMERMRCMFENIARELGIEVQEDWFEEDEHADEE